ncbi:hypothetical protein [Vibrio maerlii]|uniref:hypothetical protein n=1 Tax=Vibrio maerlii TaxID=2231648 RepID=UPI000E3BFBE8|nr:hypothetical protein [Vibrio maerlii]
MPLAQFERFAQDTVCPLIVLKHHEALAKQYRSTSQFNTELDQVVQPPLYEVIAEVNRHAKQAVLSVETALQNELGGEF